MSRRPERASRSRISRTSRAAVRRHRRVSALTGNRRLDEPHRQTWPSGFSGRCTLVTDSYDQPGGMWFNPGYPAAARHPHPRGVGRDARCRPAEPAGAAAPVRRVGRARALLAEIEGPETYGPSSSSVVIRQRALSPMPPEPERRFPRSRRWPSSTCSPPKRQSWRHICCPPVGALERADVPLLPRWLPARPSRTQFTPAIVPPVARNAGPIWRMFGGPGRTARLRRPRSRDDLRTPPTGRVRLLRPRRRTKPRRRRCRVRRASGAVVDSGAVFGWAHRLLPDGPMAACAPKPLLAQLAQAEPRCAATTSAHRSSPAADHELAAARIDRHGSDGLPEPGHRTGRRRDRGRGAGFRVASFQARCEATRDLPLGVVAIPHGWSAPQRL